MQNRVSNSTFRIREYKAADGTTIEHFGEGPVPVAAVRIVSDCTINQRTERVYNDLPADPTDIHPVPAPQDGGGGTG